MAGLVARLKAINWKKAGVAVAVVTAAAVGLAALVIWVIVPAARYGKANSLEKRGDAAGACELFDRLGGYRDAAGRRGKLQATAADSRSAGTMAFGGHDWLVLEERGGSALLLMRDVLEKRPFNETGGNTRTSWADCTLRAWLNGAFYASFGQEDRARIAETVVRGAGNREYNVKAGGDTRDFVFLLSLEEAKLYLPDDTARVARGPAGNAAWWWLRSPGEKDFLAAVVTNDGSLGYSGSGANYYDRGVRPAMWVTTRQ